MFDPNDERRLTVLADTAWLTQKAPQQARDQEQDRLLTMVALGRPTVTPTSRRWLRWRSRRGNG